MAQALKIEHSPRQVSKAFTETQKILNHIKAENAKREASAWLFLAGVDDAATAMTRTVLDITKNENELFDQVLRMVRTNRTSLIVMPARREAAT